MKARLIMNCDSAAFGKTREEAADEVARILEDIAIRLREHSEYDYGSTWVSLYDSNGNAAGHFCLKGEGDPGYQEL